MLEKKKKSVLFHLPNDIREWSAFLSGPFVISLWYVISVDDWNAVPDPDLHGRGDRKSSNIPFGCRNFVIKLYLVSKFKNGQM